jgi:ABC-2 type transport system ATP-binding protein
MTTIEVQDLSKSFYPPLRLRHWIMARGTPINALNNISFKVGAGEIMGLLGPNGAGKSTILKILSTLVLPDTGTVFINNFDIVTQAQQAKNSIGWVNGDDRSLYWRLSGRDNLEFFASLYDLKPTEASYRINELLTLLDIERPHQPVAEYSSGMKHRLNLARTLLPNPAILLLDEPTKSLDPNSAESIRYFIKELATHYKKTIIIATHNLAEAAVLCDRIGLIQHGQLKACGTMSELRAQTNAPQESELEEIYKRVIRD